MLEIQRKLPQRCDFCFYRNKGCDRALPSCSACSKRGLNCGISRKTLNNRTLHYFESQIHIFDSIMNRSDKKKINQNKDTKKTSKDNEMILNSEVSLRKKSIIQLNGTIAVITLISSHIIKHNLMVMVQFPSVELPSDGSKLLVSLFAKFLMVKANRKAINFPKQKELFIDNTSILLVKAINAFINSDLIMISFIGRKDFKISEYSYGLQLVIYVSGLIKLPKDKDTLKLINYFVEELLIITRSPAWLKPNYNNIQASLIIQLNIDFPKKLVNFKLREIDSLARHCFTLGLHLPSPRLSLSKQLERQKVFNMTMYVLSHFILYCGDINRITSCYTEKDRLKYQLQRENIFLKLTSQLTQDERMDLISSIYNDFLFDIGRLQIKLAIIKDRIASKLSSFNNLLDDVINMLFHTKKEGIRYLTILIRLSIKESFESEKELIKVYILFIDILIHHFNFFALSLQLYHRSSNICHYKPEQLISLSNILKLPNDINNITFESILIHECSLTIKLICSLKYNQFMRMHIVYLAQCLLFLMSSTWNLSNEHQELQVKGVQVLRSLQKHCFNPFLPSMYLSLLNVTDNLS